MLPERIRNSAWAVLEYAWYPALLLATTPWFLNRLGTEAFGYWMLLSATVGLGGALSAGTGSASIKTTSRALGRRENPEHLIRSALGIAILGGGALSLLTYLAYSLGDGILFGKMRGDSVMMQSTGIAAAALLWLEQVDNAVSSSIKGAEYFAHAAKLEIIGKSIQITCAVLTTWHHATLPALYAALMAGAVLRLCTKLIFARRLLNLTTWRPSLAQAKSLLNFAGWGWLQGLGAVLFGVTDRVIVGSLLGSASLAYYSIASQLAMQIHAISAAALSVLFPIISRKLEAGNRDFLPPTARLTMGGNLILSSALAAGLLVLAPFLLTPWVGKETAPAVAKLLPWLAAGYWLLSLNVAPFYILLGMGRMRFVGLVVVFSGFAGTLASWISIEFAGLDGAPAGRIVYAIGSLVLLVPIGHLLLSRRNASFTPQRRP